MPVADRNRADFNFAGGVAFCHKHFGGHIDGHFGEHVGGFDYTIAMPVMSAPHNLSRIDALLRRANAPCAGRVEWFEQIDSTNNWLMKQDDIHARICIADEQTAGRGRRGRSWQAARATAILMSLGWSLGTTNGADAGGLSLVSGLAIVAALRDVGIDSIGLKWPNDIIAVERGEKLGGVLCELHRNRCIVGWGINFSTAAEMERRIDLISLGCTADRDELAAGLAIAHCDYLRRFCAHGFAQFVDEWNALNVHRDVAVSVHSPHDNYHGIARGVDDDGALLVDVGGNGKRRVVGGEISVRAV